MLGIKSEYLGESSISLFQRGQEHLRDLADQHDESPLWKHCSSMHDGKIQEFQMRLLSKHKTAFSRQIAETVNISHGNRDNILNSKSEWMGSSIPRLTVEIRDKVQQVDHDGKRLEDAGAKRTAKTRDPMCNKRARTSNPTLPTKAWEPSQHPQPTSTVSTSSSQPSLPTTTSPSSQILVPTKTRAPALVDQTNQQ